MASYLSAFTALPPPRALTLTRQISNTPEAIWAVLVDVHSYQHFLPLTTSSTVLTRKDNGDAEKFKMKVGYPDLGIAEDWTCEVVHCNPADGVIELRYRDGKGVLESWTMKFTLQPSPLRPASSLGNPLLRADLQLRYSGNAYDQMFALLQPDVLPKIMQRLEERVKVVEERRIRADAAQATRMDAAGEMRRKLIAVSLQKRTSNVQTKPSKTAPKTPTVEPTVATAAQARTAAKRPAAVQKAQAEAKKAPKKLEVRSGNSRS